MPDAEVNNMVVPVVLDIVDIEKTDSTIFETGLMPTCRLANAFDFKCAYALPLPAYGCPCVQASILKF